MAKLTKAQLEAEATKQLLEQARIMGEMSGSLEGYIAQLKQLKQINETISYNEKQINKLKQQTVFISKEEKKIHESKIKILENETKSLKTQVDLTKENLKTINKTNLVMSKMASSTIKGMSALPGLLANSFGKLKGYGLFEMDKAVKMSALQMGLLGKEGNTFAQSVRETSITTNEIGVNLQALAQIQGQYTEELGRTVMLGDKGLKAMAAMSVATGLGAEGAGDLAANMDEIGISASRTADYVNQTMNDSHKMGLNASKVVKNIQGNIKMLNKYHFKDGIKGLAKMAELSSKLGVKMDFAASMSDKMWDIEGAVDMSAQLQVMGGAWAKMADPFHLMYMARNDMEGLTKEIANASQASMHFAKDGSIETSSLEMSRLKIIAQQTGLEYDDLVKSGKELFKMNKVKQQINFGFTEDQKEFIANTAQIGEGGKATIEIKGSTKLVSQLTQSDQKLLESQVAEKKTLEERAKASQNFDDQITNLINQVKTYMLPIIDGINQTLGPILTGFMEDPTWKTDLFNFGNKIGEFIKDLKPIFTTVGGWVKTLGPTGTFATLFGGKVLFNTAQWVLNGVSLAQGFNSASGGIGGAIGGLTKGIAKVGGYIGLATSALSIGMDAYKNYKDPALSGGEATKKTLWDNKGKLIGGVIGAGIGAFAGGVGAIPGAGIGAGIGSMFDSPSNDGIFSSPLHDGVIGSKANNKNENMSKLISSKFGSDFSKGRGIIQGGKVHPIDNKDDLLAMKKGGVIDKASNSSNIPTTIKHIFEPIEIKGSLIINTPGNPSGGVDLLKNAQFIREITSLIHVETKRQVNQKQ